MKNQKIFDTRIVHINVDPDKVWSFLSDGKNLPLYTYAYKSFTPYSDLSRSGSAIMEAQGQQMSINLQIDANPIARTIDFVQNFQDGSKAHAYTRVISDLAGGCFYEFLLFAPPLSLIKLEGTLEQQMKILETEQLKLKSILERT